ncbi:TPA: hypothetical protein HA225_03860 [Candidatus Micrarchaeota archaeon]|nr:hypothetical protein [Candidatus Micrarchaeota archaeon]HIH30144.1 hypothetical protein [Candidatus Micrarchaeota archaeon]
MSSVKIASEEAVLVLSQARGKVRIADENGNHISKPTEAKYEPKYTAEWMITNDEVEKLVRVFLEDADRIFVIEEIKKLEKFIRDTEYATREALKTTTQEIKTFEGFRIFKYTENFYSFERELKSKIRIRIVFKMGDYTLAPHMFVLLPFSLNEIEIKNRLGNVNKSEMLGSGCRAIWKPKKEDVKEVVIALAHLSRDHRNDLIRILS